MSTPSNMVPEGRIPLDHAIQMWDRARKELTVFLNETKRPDDPMQQYFLFGTLSAENLVDLFEAHTYYHEHLFPSV